MHYSFTNSPSSVLWSVVSIRCDETPLVLPLYVHKDSRESVTSRATIDRGGIERIPWCLGLFGPSLGPRLEGECGGLSPRLVFESSFRRGWLPHNIHTGCWEPYAKANRCWHRPDTAWTALWTRRCTMLKGEKLCLEKCIAAVINLTHVCSKTEHSV